MRRLPSKPTPALQQRPASDRLRCSAFRYFPSPSPRAAAAELCRHALIRSPPGCAGTYEEGLGVLLVRFPRRRTMPLGLTLGSLGRAMRRKRPSSLDILSSKRALRDYYKGKNCKPTGFHTRKGGYVVVDEKLPRFAVPDLTHFKLKPFVSQCARDLAASTTSSASLTSAQTTESRS
ncbi:39S ribosomal protein L41-A, mitochondrial [Zea mays]|uniref:39S ribosomal protein L41-A, mitochondrial n=1 Tax=Zea mays TaxID=4577 RepID=A0A317Y1V6_MAIZE|nr:39S ribosomal protein L41-A, mitochondrial [Zea mays]